MQKAVNLPLHPGHAPRWLFNRMVRLSGLITEYIVDEFGEEEFFRRMYDPLWFQAFGCVLGFDWHSSGLTTTTLGALKLALEDRNLGIYVAGGKGRVSRRTPEEIVSYGDRLGIAQQSIEEQIRLSRLTAKIDNSCIQDGYQIYHHTFIFSKDYRLVIQQGMNTNTKSARRYHWLNPDPDKMFNSDEENIITGESSKNTLDLASPRSEKNRELSVEVITELPRHHRVLLTQLSKREVDKLTKLSELDIQRYEELLLIRGIGPKKLRALSLLAELIYGEPPDWRDPAKYSFAHGGKDGHPYPVDRKTYDESIEFFQTVLDGLDRIDVSTRKKALLRLYRLNKKRV